MLTRERKLNYEIIRSGSSGNAVLVEDMLFDIGVSFKTLKEYLYRVKYIFITHRHSDHFNPKTYKQIKKKFPRITWIVNYDLAVFGEFEYFVGDKTRVEIEDGYIQSFLCVHDVPCSGFAIRYKDFNLIYATDTNTLEHAPVGKYDYLFIESNHDENKIKQIQGVSKQKYGYDAWAGSMRHLSTQQSKAFYYLNRRDKDSVWVELHKSGRFY